MSHIPCRRHAHLVPVRLEVLTPVHIGTGDMLSPIDYVVRQADGSWWLHYIDLDRWFVEYPDQQRLQKLLDKGDINKFWVEVDTLDAASYSLSRCRIVKDEMGANLQKERQNLNNSTDDKKAPKLEIMPHIRNPVSKLPYIPGSSLKGAIRTAVLDLLDQNRKIKGEPQLRERYDALLEQKTGRGRKPSRYDEANSYADVIKEMLGKINDNAFRGLVVSDFSLSPGTNSLVKAIERKQDTRKSGPQKPYCEVVSENSESYGRITLGGSNGQPGLTMPDNSFLPWQDMVAACNSFYRQRWQDELNKFYAADKQLNECLKNIEKRFAQSITGNQAMLMRIGRYSHIECMTVTDRGAEDGTTRTLANGEWPFGWVLLHFCEQDTHTAGMESLEKSHKKHAQAQSAQKGQSQAAIALAEQQQQSTQQARLQQQSVAKQADERKQRRLTMTLEGRVLFDLQNGAVIENDIGELWKKLDDLTPEKQLEFAQALALHWQNTGKWSGAQTVKQKAKVEKLQSILSRNRLTE